AQKKFEILCYPYIKKYPELETSASLKVLFFKKQYTNFLQSDVLKNVMFDFGMNVLGYTNTMISGDEHPVGGHNEKKSTVVKKSAEDRAKNEKEYAEIDALEKKMLKQEQQIDAFEILIDEHSDRSNVVSEYHTKIQEIIEQMKKEKAQLDALKIEVAKEIVEPEYHKKVSGWSTMTNEKAVEILTASVLDEKKAVEAAQVLLDVNKSFSPAEIEQAVVEEKQEIAQMQDAEQQEKYTQALTVAEKVLKEQVVLSDIVDQPISDEFRVAIQKDGINIAQDLLKKGKNINEMMDESNFANVDWSDQQIAYAMGYVQSCMNILQQIATKHSVFSIIRVVEILKNINSAVSQVHG
ncbi:hypothetical protein KBB68_04105, partial [Candidatus Babeliales bacterium]|nr:hypothetical protein [Candidatus Babeliales bacterium]